MSKLIKFIFSGLILSLLLTIQVSAGTANVLRLRSGSDYLYTTSMEERYQAACFYKSDYHEEGIEFSASPAASGLNKPVYRLYNARTRNHFYTINLQEVAFARNAGFSDEGIAFYAYESAQPNSTPVYRIYSKVRNDHQYLANISTRDLILNNTTSAIPYVDEGIAFWVASSGTVPVYSLFGIGNDFLFWNHFYTTNIDESRRALCQSGSPGYELENITFSVSEKSTGSYTLPVYRYNHFGKHIFSATPLYDPSQVTFSGEYNPADYWYEGIAFYTSTTSSVNIYGYKNGTGYYIYVRAGSEKDYLDARPSEWVALGVIFKADEPCSGVGCLNATN